MSEPDSSQGNDFDAERLEKLVAMVLEEAALRGATAAEAGLSLDRGLSIGVRLGEVETIEHHRSQGLGVTVYFGQRKGSASTTDLNIKALHESVEAACRIARYAAEDEFAGLPEPGLLATNFPDLSLYHPWDLTPEEGIRLALACEHAALSHDPAITNSEGASISTFSGYRVLGNSLGFLHGHASSRHSLSCSVIGQQGDSMQRDDWWTVARSCDGLESAVAVGVKAAERTVQRLGARSLTTRQCPVVFAADLAGGFFGHFIAAIRGGNLYRKSSFLLDSLGQKIFPDFLHIHEQPYISGALGSAAYDGEGVQTRAHDLVKDGILQSYVLNTYSARKLGMSTTGNAGGVHNLTIDPGSLDLAGLLETMQTGLLVTELMGQGINLVTGDYSRGAAGFWVENGAIQYPVEEITIAGNLRDMFLNIQAVGNDIDKRGGTWSGSVLIEKMTVAGN